MSGGGSSGCRGIERSWRAQKRKRKRSSITLIDDYSILADHSEYVIRQIMCNHLYVSDTHSLDTCQPIQPLSPWRWCACVRQVAGTGITKVRRSSASASVSVARVPGLAMPATVRCAQNTGHDVDVCRMHASILSRPLWPSRWTTKHRSGLLSRQKCN